MMCVFVICVVFFFKQKTAYEMRISDWSSDVCSSDLGLEIVEGRRCGHFESALTSFEAGRKRMRTRLLQSSPSNETRGSFDLIRGPLLRWRNGPRIKSGVTKEGVDEDLAKLA